MTAQAGDYFVVRTGGWVARAIRVLTRSDVNHAGVAVGGGRIVEAQPAGARVALVANYPDAIWSTIELTEQQRTAIAAAAAGYVGVPYNFVDIAALFFAQGLGWKVPAAVRRRLSRPDRMICSQLVDQAYSDGGVQLFDDGRMPGDVTPGDLRRLISPADLRRLIR